MSSTLKVEEVEKVYVDKPYLPYTYVPNNKFLKIIIFLLSGFQQTYTMLHVLLFGFIFAPIRLFHTGLYQKLESSVWCHAAKLHLFMTNYFVGIPTHVNQKQQQKKLIFNNFRFMVIMKAALQKERKLFFQIIVLLQIG